MIVHLLVDRLRVNCPNIREIPVMFPTSLITWNYYDISRVFGKGVPNDSIKDVVRVPVLVISINRKSLFDKKTLIALNRFGLYSSELYFWLFGYRLVPYSNQTALIKACSEPCPTYDFERVELCNSKLVQKYKSSYYLSGTSPKFEKNFFLLLFDHRSDAVKVLRNTLEVFREIFDLLGADFNFHQTKIYSLIEYMYNPTALFGRELVGLRWCRAFISGLLKGVVDASEVSTDFLVRKDFEIVRWD
jgi:hypothetical protein